MKTCWLLVLYLSVSTSLYAQQVDIEGLKDVFKAKPVKFNGGLSASTIFYDGNGNTGRDPFTWYLQGNANANLFGKINLPFSFNFTNAGSGFSYPVMPNRLSLHPTYKWISGHIGDVSMSFSPYTLNGHQFRGAGLDLSPKGNWKFSAMAGRLQRAVAYDSANLNGMPAYERWGYGFKTVYEEKWWKLGVNTFYANDKAGSLAKPLDSLELFPQQNLAIAYEIGIRPVKGMELTAEYANSALTRDTRDTSKEATSNGNGYMRKLMKGNSSTVQYAAFKSQLNYIFLKTTVGVGYERVNPGYTTLGAYYFNNDLENITLNLAQSMLKDKVSMALNIGSQRDNLDNKKESTTRRWVGAINVNYLPSDRLQTSLNYSSFQTYMNIRPQFDYINNVNPIQNFDTLKFTQLSQNASLNINYITKRSEWQQQSLNVNATFQDASDEQGGVVGKGNSSQFYNLATSYGVLYLQRGLNLVFAYNLSYNTIARNDFITQGPTVSANAKLFKKKLTTGLSSSYNSSTSQGKKQNTVLSVRLNAAYTLLKKHNINFSLFNQYRSVLNRGSTRDLTGTLGYSFGF